MRRVVGDMQQARADELLVERGDLMAGGALLGEQRLARVGVAARPDRRRRRPRRPRPSFSLSIHLLKAATGSITSLPCISAMIDAAKLGADDVVRAGAQRREVEILHEPGHAGRLEPDLRNPKLMEHVGRGDQHPHGHADRQMHRFGLREDRRLQPG
jgi:hypothetical protein